MTCRMFTQLRLLPGRLLGRLGGVANYGYLDAEGADREAKGTSKLQRLQLSLSADSQRRRCELDASDRQCSTGLVRGGKPRPFIPARRWVIGRRVRLEKKGRRRHKCGCGRVWKCRRGSDSGDTNLKLRQLQAQPGARLSVFFPCSHQPHSLFLPYSYQQPMDEPPSPADEWPSPTDEPPSPLLKSRIPGKTILIDHNL